VRPSSSIPPSDSLIAALHEENAGRERVMAIAVADPDKLNPDASCFTHNSNLYEYSSETYVTSQP
jgi:hypothetical protein